MRYIVLFSLFVMVATTGKARQKTLQFYDREPVSLQITRDTTLPGKTINSDSKIFTSVEQNPEFPGGQGFYKYLGANLHYPAEAVKNRTQGKVFVSFIVEKDGNLSEVKIVKGVSEEIDAEAIRVVQNSPKWIPARQNGRPVRVIFTVPISFSLTK